MRTEKKSVAVWLENDDKSDRVIHRVNLYGFKRTWIRMTKHRKTCLLMQPVSPSSCVVAEIKEEKKERRSGAKETKEEE